MSGKEGDRIALMEEIAHRGQMDTIFKTAFHGLEDFSLERVEDYDCYRYMVNSFETACGKFSDYSLKYAKFMAYTCNTKTEEEVQNIVNKFSGICTEVFAQ